MANPNAQSGEFKTPEQHLMPVMVTAQVPYLGEIMVAGAYSDDEDRNPGYPTEYPRDVLR